jgi:hypothetical protein
MDHSHPLFALAGLGDAPGFIMLAFLALWPLHAWSLFSYLGISTTVTKGLIQSGALLAFAAAAALMLRRRDVRTRYKILVVALGYPLVVFVTNVFLGL